MEGFHTPRTHPQLQVHSIPEFDTWTDRQIDRMV
jgi:hypothetical protein